MKWSKYASVGSQKINLVYILFGDRIRNIDRKLESKIAFFLNHLHVHVLASLDISTLTITIIERQRRFWIEDHPAELLTNMYWLRWEILWV